MNIPPVQDLGNRIGNKPKVEDACFTFDEIYDKYAPLVRYILKKSFDEIEVVNDLTQDIFVKVYGSPTTYKLSDNEAMKRVICKITTCTIVDYIRYIKRNTKHTDKLINSTLKENLIHYGSTELSMPQYRELKRKSYRELKQKRGSRIAKRTVRLVALRCLGFTQQECAEKLDISRSIIQIDLEKLREIVSRLYPEYQSVKN